MDIRRIFGTNVRHHRLAAGLSQEALAVRMGVDRAYISWIETARQNATLLTVWQASQALGVRPADLLDESHFPTDDQK
ncbi:helix-turn-helix domain-containing protein [Gluconobacter morbifer]|uniref:XRE family transcriptional regulator n=1 Tax=Gluconobacter morbifer G707 TaxID=1088869 RepID=G6XM65_9PROT|nr:helix-turn-helix transcriptional regulator [Gluconobacter morbifer]EHH67153.1 XRE family transcriptional regulator [Gluconobacter morbifer G707]